MPRLGLAVNEDYAARSRTVAPDRFGRRVRHVQGVQIHDEKSGLSTPFFVKFALWLSVIAVIASSLALWRLFSFPH